MPNRIDHPRSPQHDLHEPAGYEPPQTRSESWRPDPHPEAGRRREEHPVPLREVTQASFRGLGPQTYTRSDARIHEDICDRLTEDDRIDARLIDVKVVGGEVALSGRVPARSMKYLTEEIAETVPGVRDVQNQIRVSRDQPAMRPAIRTDDSGGGD